MLGKRTPAHLTSQVQEVDETLILPMCRVRKEGRIETGEQAAKKGERRERTGKESAARRRKEREREWKR